MIDSVTQVSNLFDVPRKIVVHLQLINQAFSWMNLIIWFIKNPTSAINPILGITDSTLRKFQFTRTILTNTVNLVRNHILMANHIVGLLSSSYQGEIIIGGGKRRP